MSEAGTTQPSRPASPTALSSGSLPLRIALRYLRSTRRDAFVSFLSLAAACGIGLGIAALILALAALSGFQGALRSEILARTPEIAISPPPGADPVALARSLKALEGVAHAQALLRGTGWILRDGAARPVEMVAFEGELPTLFPGVRQREQGLYLGRTLAHDWGIEPGDVVEVVSARPTLTPIGPQPRVRRIPVAGLFETGRTEYLDRLALPWREGQSLIGNRGSQVLVASGDLDQVDATVALVEPLLPEGATLETWRELNQALLFALRLEKSLMFLGIFLIVVVATLALVSSLMLILASKRSEVGMLRAMGAPAGTVRRIFLWLACVLAGAGAIGGVTLGSSLAWALDRWRLLSLPDQVYFLEYVPFQLSLSDLLVVLASSMLLAGACSSWAAGRAAGLDPVEALRR